MRQPRRYYEVPEASPARVLINPKRGFLSVVIALQRTNLVTNPSGETGITGLVTRGTIVDSERTTDQQYHGVYSFYCTPSTADTAAAKSGGIGWGSITPTASTTYAASCKFKGRAGVPYKFYVENSTGPVAIVTKEFIATGRWQWLTLLYTEPSSPTGTRNLIITKNNSRDGGVFYWDGLQFESCADGILQASTYIDGDQVGLLPRQSPAPYRWNGTPHGSTSIRDGTTNAGGYVKPLDRFGFLMLAAVGLGLAPVTNVITTGAGTDGAQFQAIAVNARQISIKGVFRATTPTQLDRLRSDLYDAVGPDNVVPRQPVTLLYQPFDGERETGDTGRIVALYQSGLEGLQGGVPREEATITFTQHLPAIYGSDDGAALTTQQSVANANRIIQRSGAGVWSAMGTGAASTDVHDLVRGLDGRIYATGGFSSMGGVANTSRIAYWDPADNAWHAMGTGLSGGNGDVLVVAPNGDVIVGGSFTSAGGVANTLRIARWDGTNWNALSTGANGAITALVYDTTGNLYAGGSFTSIGGVATSFIAKWNGSAWSALSSIPNSAVLALVRGLDGTIYAGGTFATIGGSPFAAIAAWSGSSWSTLGAGITGGGAAVKALAVSPSGKLYVGGDFTNAGGLISGNIAEWTGSAWRAFSEGYPNAPVDELEFDERGVLHVGGEFTQTSIVLPTTGLALWYNGVWFPADVILPATVTAVYAILSLPDGGLVIGWDGSAGTATASAVTTVTNDGTARAYPTIVLKNPTASGVRVYALANTTIGRGIPFNNLTLSAGETMTIYVTPQGMSVISTLRGDITSAILPGSIPDLSLKRGANAMACFLGSANATAAMRWTNAYQSANDLIW